LIRRVGPLPEWPCVSAESLIEAMRSDKKTRGGKIRFVLSPRLGKAQSYNSVSLDTVKRVLHFAPHFLTRQATGPGAGTRGKLRG
jgi:3-dehydroquinate synthetase